MVTSHVESLAKSIASREGLCDPEIEIKPGSKKGDGFTGDVLMVTVKDSKGNRMELVFKCAITDQVVIEKYFTREVYRNEEYFYSIILPTIRQFQEDKCFTQSFKSVARYYGSLFENDIRLIALENLKISKFELFGKISTVDDEHVRTVFTEYGKFHGLFFAYKDQYPEKFSELARNLHDCWSLFSSRGGFMRMFQEVCEEVIAIFTNLENHKVLQCLERYTNAKSVFEESRKYRSEYSTLNHGDCWTNNIMFKYKHERGTKKLDEIRILDWQMCNIGSPVYDLSYFLYSSGSKEVFDKLDVYLGVYHDSLSNTIRNLGSDPEKLYPFSQLKSEWKEYCSFGFLLSMLVQRIKLVQNDDIRDLLDIKNASSAEEEKDMFLGGAYDKATFDKRARDLVLHLYEINAL